MPLEWSDWSFWRFRWRRNLNPKKSRKQKVTYTPHLDSGDYVVVINAAKVKLTGRKEEQKTYYKHSGYPGGFKEVAFSKLKKEQPEKIILWAVYGMLAGNRLRNQRMKRLL